jgi:HAMP domain-containing protein
MSSVPGGPPGSGSDGSLPDLKQPPGQIEGAGGGPALPSGPAGTSSDKAGYRQTSEDLNYLAAFMALDAVGAAAFGAEPMAVGFAAFAAMAAGASHSYANLADNDPPQPYQEIVHFERQASAPPGLGDPAPVLATVAIASQYVFFASVTAQGALVAVERLADAMAAGDYDWAVTHQGVLHEATARIPIDLALVAAALRAAGFAMRGTPADVKLTPGQRGAGQWVANPANEAALSRYLGQSGYTAGQSAEAIAWMRSDPAYQGQPSAISEQLVVVAERLYQTAERLVTSA